MVEVIFGYRINAKKIQEHIANQLQTDLLYAQMILKKYMDLFTREPVNGSKHR